MDGLLRVELADLRGWADQVGRAGDDCAYLAEYVSTFVPDGDFGPILEPIRSDYERFAGRVREILPVDAARLADTRAALHTAATRFARTDARVAQDFGIGASILDDGRASPRFRADCPTTPEAPARGGEVLPVVSFGLLFDQANDLLVRIGAPDLRREVTDFVAGDIGKALAQASAWENAAQTLAAVRGNLADGSSLVSRTWAGEAASSSRACTAALATALATQSEALARVAEHVRDAVAQAVDVAQLVVDTVRHVVAVVAAGMSFAHVPVFGQVHLVDKFKDAVKLVWDARKVMAVFWTFLLVMKDCFVAAVDCLTAQSLPPALSMPARAA